MRIKYMMLFVVLLPCYLSAIDHTTDTRTVKELITAVKQAPVEKRRVLMNTLKLKLRATQQATRNQVMIDLRKSFHSHTAIRARNHTAQKRKHRGMCEAKGMNHRMHKGKGKKYKPNPPKKHDR